MHAPAIEHLTVTDRRRIASRTDGSAAEHADDATKRLCRIGAFAALGTVAVAVIQAPLFILAPQPTTVLGHFDQFQRNTLAGLVGLDLMLLLAEALAALVLLGLYAALRRASPTAMAIALGAGLGGIALYFVVNPTLAMLYLSDQYAAASTEAQRSAFLAAGEALLANYNGTAFGLFFVFGGVADLIIAAVMLRSGRFGKATAAAGILTGVLLLVPPLPSLGPIPLALSYIVIVPSVIWNILIARGLLQLADGKGGA
ncbi:MAG TPA: DUF4386 family protein [Thermomicrobiales bacterium]